MSTELDDLFEEASPRSDRAPHVGRIWAGGRRRRRGRQAGALLGTLALIAVVGVAATSLDGVRTPTVDTAAAPDAEEVEERAPEEPAFELEREPNELAELVVPEPEPVAEQDPGDDADAGEDVGEATGESAPEPDPARVAAPCAAHEGGSPDSFIDVVSPVDGQQASAAVELVGCARVYEATVRYRLTGPDGAVLSDSFTTATAGGPELGEFRETVAIGQGRHTLEVFWDSPADGSERDRSVITVEGQ